MRKILVTGGAGYIGSHTCVELLNSNHNIVVVDNLSNSSKAALDRVEEITGKKLAFEKVDLLDELALKKVFEKHPIDSVIHFAGLKAVDESVEKPLYYYENNIGGTINLLKVMSKHQVKKIIFSSSATVYGDPASVPITEDFSLTATNPYGRTKLFIEEILKDVFESNKNLSIVMLRYFNPIGAHESGKIGEDPKGIPNNLLPYVSKVAIGELEELSVFGGDYDTRDGTCVRDYIHIVDLADGHVKAMNKFSESGVHIYNLGTGKGTTVLEIVKAFEKASGKKVPFKIVGRRPGDVAENYANAQKAEKELDWKAKYDIEKMCKDTWTWQSNNPKGYKN